MTIDKSSPESVARAYLDAIAGCEWASAVRFIDADFMRAAIKPFRDPVSLDPSDVPTSDGDLDQVFAGVSSRAELADLSDSAAFARCLEAWSLDPVGITPPSPRRLRRIVGTLTNDAIAHVVYYAGFDGEVPTPHVLVLRRTQQGWGVLPTATALRAPPETLFSDPFVRDW